MANQSQQDGSVKVGVNSNSRHIIPSSSLVVALWASISIHFALDRCWSPRPVVPPRHRSAHLGEALRPQEPLHLQGLAHGGPGDRNWRCAVRDVCCGETAGTVEQRWNISNCSKLGKECVLKAWKGECSRISLGKGELALLSKTQTGDDGWRGIGLQSANLMVLCSRVAWLERLTGLADSVCRIIGRLKRLQWM